MKIEKYGHANYFIYDYSSVVSLNTIHEDIKKIFDKLQKRLKLNGFYRVIASLKSIGLFMKVERIEEAFYKDTIDLKIEVDSSLDVYYVTEDYFLVKDLGSVRYFEGKYYALVDNSFDKILEKVEFGYFILDKNIGI